VELKARITRLINNKDPHMRQALHLILLLLSTTALADEGLVAHWNFNDGRGEKLTDYSGNDNHGTLHGGKWVRSGEGFALRLDGVDDYVDCGNGESLNIAGPLTMEVWVQPIGAARGEPGIIGKFYDHYALTYYRGGSWFYISGGGNGTHTPIKSSQWQHMVCVFDGKQLQIYKNSELVKTHISKFPKPKPGGGFRIGALFGDEDNPDIAQRNTAFFSGMVDEVRIYNRAITHEQIIDHYNQHAEQCGLIKFDKSKFGKLAVDAYVYPKRREVLAQIDYKWIKPISKDVIVTVELNGQGHHAVNELKPNGPRDRVETKFTLPDGADGPFGISVKIGEHQAQTKFTLPIASIKLPSPAVKIAPPLPTPVQPPGYGISIGAFGGITLTIDNVSFPIESTFSFPNGGDNGFTVATRDDVKSENAWRVSSTSAGDVHHIHGEGDFYSIHRKLRIESTRVIVEDTITNKTDQVLGIILSNQVNMTDMDGEQPFLRANPTLFAKHKGRGVGLVALDDVYYLQLYNRFKDGIVELRDEHFGLDKKASYTVKWAIYPTATDDYYDFINQVRHDEKINGHLEGGLTLSTGWEPLSHKEVRIKNLGYLSQCYLTRVTKDPVLSIEGWEYREYPEVTARIKNTLTGSRRKHPQVKVGFHVAHSLFVMNNPERFADSKAISADGSQHLYGSNNFAYYGRYFSKELFDQNWRWWIFLPTMENSFGKYMIESADYMINELGANFVWADGYISGYVRDGYVYDRFDGHSVTIDLKTKLVTRTKANVTLTALPVLKKVAQMFDDAGGRLVSNGRGGPPSYWKYNTITSNETGGGDQQPISGMHLSRTVTPLGNPGVIKSERDIYHDVLAKLDLGALYLFYGETDHRPRGHNYVHEESLVTYMYPITFDHISPGTVRGLQRIVTKKSGTYGWHRDRSLHNIYYSDSIGRIISNRFVTTVDADSVRTVLDFAKNESAVIEKMPATAQSAAPLNVMVRQYDQNGAKLLVHGKGAVRFHFKNGRFPVYKGLIYQITTNGKPIVLKDNEDDLQFTVYLSGPATIKVEHFLPGK